MTTKAVCTLKRCQGKRGCVCPSGSIPIGSYAGRKLEPLPPPMTILASPASKVSPFQKPSAAGSGKSPPRKLSPLLKQVKDKSVSEEAGQRKTHASATEAELSVIKPPSAVSVEEDYSHLNGEVMIRYNHYKKTFKVEKGTTTAAAIDEEYYLSFAFPNSKIHVSLYSPSDFSYEKQGFSSRPRIQELPVGTYIGLDPSKEYWVDIEEDETEKKLYEERQDKLAAENAEKRRRQEEEGVDKGIIQSKSESCSCIEGNPCLDRYACKDWNNRYEVAKKNGWKGF